MAAFSLKSLPSFMDTTYIEYWKPSIGSYYFWTSKRYVRSIRLYDIALKTPSKRSILYSHYFLSDNLHDRFVVAAYRACLKILFIHKKVTKMSDKN